MMVDAAGNHVFARSGFPHDQDGSIVAANSLHRAQQLAHGVAATNHRRSLDQLPGGASLHKRVGGAAAGLPEDAAYPRHSLTQARGCEKGYASLDRSSNWESAGVKALSQEPRIRPSKRDQRIVLGRSRGVCKQIT